MLCQISLLTLVVAAALSSREGTAAGGQEIFHVTNIRFSTTHSSTMPSRIAGRACFCVQARIGKSPLRHLPWYPSRSGVLCRGALGFTGG